ncbi:uncharacterized protein LOC135685329 [Rhopilema esculentum]|uniref:uncharacterized protein LOC135685329 n=1 Tax=Rhopilema esculentum TaxID=499914 RepID=UPI0031CF1649|eukprot:gene17687-9341_t
MAIYIIVVLVTAAIINYILLVKSVKTTPKNKETASYKRAHALITVGFVLSFITASFIVYFVWIFPTWFKILSFVGALHCCAFFYLWINIVFNYLTLVFTSPGKGYTLSELDEEGYSAKNRPICGKCRRLQCQGTFHCNQCAYCVRLFSHHSYLANNCVGLNNFSYFYLLLWYSLFGEIYGLWQLYGPFRACILHIEEQTSDCVALGDCPWLFLVLLLALVFTAKSLLFHTILLRMDVSQIDFLTELKTSSSLFSFAKYLCFKIFKRKLSRHRMKHLLFERKPQWKHIFLPSLNEPPIDLSAEDVIDYELEAGDMV